MRFFSIFFIVGFFLYFSPVFIRGLEKLYEHGFLTYHLSQSAKKRDGVLYNNSFLQKGFIKEDMSKELSLFLEDPELFMKAFSCKLVKTRAGQRLYSLDCNEKYFLKVFEQKGFIKNLFRENRALRSDDGVALLKRGGLESFETIGLVVKRSIFCSKGYHLSKALRSCNALEDFNSLKDRNIVKKMPDIFAALRKNNIIHGDLTPKNIIALNKNFYVIDPCDVHIYPKYSPLFYLRHSHEISFCYRHFDYE